MSEMAVICETSSMDEARSAFSGFDVRAADGVEEARSCLEAFFADDVDIVAPFGGDRLIATVATAYHRATDLKRHPLRLSLLPHGELQTVWRSSGGRASTVRKAVAALEEALDRETFARTSVPSVRVVASSEPAGRLAFNVGFGVVHRVFDAYRRTGRTGATGLAATVGRLARETARGESVFEPMGGRISFDYDVTEEPPGFILVSALPQSWFDVAMAAGPSVRTGAGLDLLRQGSRIGRFFDRAAGTKARRFERIHIDDDTGYVVDGYLAGSVRPQVVQVARGPNIQLVQPR